MSLTDFFINLEEKELSQATNWYEGLRTIEKGRVQGTLEIINQTDFDLSHSEGKDTRPMTVIVAGSSIDTNTYKDIDLFLLSQTSLFSKNLKRMNPKSIIHQLDNKLPAHTYPIIYRELDFLYGQNPYELIESGKGAMVTVSIFYELQGFKNRRSDKSDDLLEPEKTFGAQEIIKYNRHQNSKFLVLSRQYTPQ